jgi:hypothetical protein
VTASASRQDAASPEELHFIQIVFDRFRARGEWPLVDDLRHQLDLADDDLDVVGVGGGLDPALGLLQIGPQGRATLTIQGVALCSGSKNVLRDLLRTLAYAYRRYRRAGTAAQVTSAGLAEDLRMGPVRVRRTYELIHWLPGIGGGSGDGTEAWSREITADVTRFKRVQTVPELLSSVPRPRRYVAEQSATAWISVPTSIALSHPLQKLGERVRSETGRMIENVEKDPAVAITSARALVESVCKEALEGLGEPVSDRDDLAVLYRKTATALRVDPIQHHAVYRQALQGLVTAVDGLAVLRNRLGSAHGPGRSAPPPDVRHARLAAGAAMTVAVFIADALDSVRANMGSGQGEATEGPASFPLSSQAPAGPQ